MKTCFDLQYTSGSARAGVLHTRRGTVQTPFFMTVGTQAAIKGGVCMTDLSQAEAPVLLCNTYHLHLRPGEDTVAQLGGLHDFTKWSGPILTDSGGFQVFSLGRKKITDEGVRFHSHINGDTHFLDPEKSIDIQLKLGSDMLMIFDECPPNVPKYHKIRRAVERTAQWARRSKDAFMRVHDFDLSCEERPLLFGIVQGGSFADLRERSLQDMLSIGFDGYALGGLAVGESTESMYEVLDLMAPQLPEDHPRYLMGVGTPANILEAIERGIDMFDCVLPMRNARHGSLITHEGQMKITNASYARDESVLDPRCKCRVCQEGYSRAYLSHLYRAGEDLGKRLGTIHNVSFYHQLLREAREHICVGDFAEWKREFVG